MPCEGEKGDHGDGQGRWGVERGVGGGDATRVKGEKEMGERGKKGKKKKQVERVKKQKAGRGEEVGGRGKYGIKVERKILGRTKK
jgi:hypothetical protein